MLLNEERDEITDRTILEPVLGRTDCGIDVSGCDPGKFLDQSARDLSQRLLLCGLAHRYQHPFPPAASSTNRYMNSERGGPIHPGRNPVAERTRAGGDTMSP